MVQRIHRKEISQIAWSFEGSVVVTLSVDSTFSVFNIPGKVQVGVYSGVGRYFLGVC